MAFTCAQFDAEKRRLEKRPTRELRAIIRALDLHAWHNTPEEQARLEAAWKIVAGRKKTGSR